MAKSRQSIIRSVRRSEYAHLTDEQVSALYVANADERAAIYAAADAADGVPTPAECKAFEDNEAASLALDDELCARDLPLPGTRKIA